MSRAGTLQGVAVAVAIGVAVALSRHQADSLLLRALGRSAPTTPADTQGVFA